MILSPILFSVTVCSFHVMAASVHNKSQPVVWDSLFIKRSHEITMGCSLGCFDYLNTTYLILKTVCYEGISKLLSYTQMKQAAKYYFHFLRKKSF